MTHNRGDQSCRIVVLLIACLLVFLPERSAPSLAQQGAESERTTYRVNDRPDSGIAYEKVARFKLATRKKEYHVGETVGLAFAMLNVSDKSVYFLRLEWPDFSFRVGAGPEQRLPPFLLVHRAVLPDNFNLLEPNQTVSGSMLLLAGCPGKYNRKAEGLKNRTLEIDDRTGFEQGRFGNLEQGCIPFSTAGEYTITALYANAAVVEDRERAGTKTAVGSIRSEPLTIVITDK
jgi:hypothetical protein